MPNLEVAVSSSNAPERPLPKYCASKIWYVLFLCLPMMFGPNITGSAKMDKNASGLPVIFDGSGALSVSTRTISENVAYYNTSGVTPVEGVLSFSARSSNSIYSGSTVQPSAIRLMLCIKI